MLLSQPAMDVYAASLPSFGPPVLHGDYLPPERDAIVKKKFDKWDIRLASENSPMAYFFEKNVENKGYYYDKIEATINLYREEGHARLDAGSLVFFNDKIEELPPPLNNNNGRSITLFYRISDFTKVLQTIEAKKQGALYWEAYEIRTSDNTISSGIWGWLWFENK